MSDFHPSFLLKNGHLSTIWPTLFRKDSVSYQRERILTEDGDFLDLDWKTTGSNHLLVIGHGLEGSANSSYVMGLTRNAVAANFDVVAINWRGCSGESNAHFASYHTGKSDDLHVVMNHILKEYTYPSIAYAGFSMGGNIGLKYAGECAQSISTRIQKIVAISTPVDLESSSRKLAEKENSLYMYRFLRTLKSKYLEKVKRFPEKELDTEKILNAKTFLDFDDHFTAPANGFIDGVDYWTKSSSKPFLKAISVHSLIINAENDPFLPEKCYPFAEVKANPFLRMIVPRYGGHVGFIESMSQLETTWAEKEILKFIS